GAVEGVGRPELVYKPDDLVRVADDIGGELRADDELDRAPVRLVEVEHAPEEGLAQDAGVRVPLVRNAHERDLVAAPPQFLDERLREDLGAPVRVRSLRMAEGDSHGREASPED